MVMAKSTAMVVVPFKRTLNQTKPISDDDT